ncbi:MAG: SulP family inorganic anion transporter [Gammaproteobacteria bacterium]|jgi:SulP family sulfate permease
MFKFNLSNLRGDIYGGLTAGVVALPLALAFGEASGAGPMAGVYGAIFVGFFASLFGGTGSQISGPTGPMIVVFAGVFASLSGDLGLIFATVVLAGLLQIAFGALKLGQYIRLVPYPVVSGFMSGIGCIIIALQTARLFGHEPEGGGTVPALLEIPGAVMDPNFSALILGALTLFIVFKWPKTWGRILPGPLAALIIGTLLSLALSGAPILGNIPTGLPSFIMPTFSTDTAFVVLEAAVILALLGAIDSLLTSLVADNMTRTRHDSNRELIGQGIGNMAAGFFGGIPGAGATMRTVVNIRTGGLTKISGMLHSLLLLAVVAVLAPLAALIPHAVLAGILVKVGYDIIDFAYLKRAHQGPRWDLALMVVVLGLTVFVDLITAVAAGVVLASLAFVKQMADAQLKSFGGELPKIPVDTSPEEAALLRSVGDKVTLFDFGGPLSFGAAADVGHHVRERVKSELHQAIVLDFSRVPFVDVSAARAVETIGCDARHSGKRVFMSGMNDQVRSTLAGLNADHCLPKDTHFDSRVDAIRAAVAYVEDKDVPSASASDAERSQTAATAST